MNKLIGILMVQIVLLSCASASSKNNPWTFTRGLDSGTRGGTSQGIPVTITNEVTESWKKVREEGISDFERDRRAILALQGEFKTTFEFLETMLLDTKLGFDTPYASWGTEFVKLIEDKGDFISLQHILVMTIVDSSGNTIGPYVVKHWTQDWTWQPNEKLVFQGENHWKTEKVRRKQSKGKWLWTVYQVDDTPRYSTLGSWTHLKSASTFDSGIFSRPLPRREFSVRSDYKLLLGKDSLVLTPNSWFHEQRNFKHVNKLGQDNALNESPLLSREIGHNSYLRIKDYDFTIGYDYWTKTSPYWADVRAVWREHLRTNSEFKLKKSFEGKRLFQYHFENAENEDILKLTSKERRALIKNLLNNFFK